MNGWGRASFLMGVVLSIGAGCGGRTSALEGDSGDPDDGNGGSIATGGATAGKPGKPGKGGTKSGGGTRNVGGSGSAGDATYGGAPAGGYAAGGYSGFYPGGGYGGYDPVGGAFPYGGYGGVGPTDCESCLRQSCAPQLVQCFQDYGCISIFGCVQSNGCQAFECYSDRYCKAVIDQWGGPAGPSMNELLQTFVCAFNAGCQCE